MDESVIFSLAERPVKLLLADYLRQFHPETIDEFCNANGINRDKARKYSSIATFMKKMANIDQKYINHTSILKIPPKAGDFTILHKNTGDYYRLFADMVPADTPWDEAPYNIFGEDKKYIKAQIGNIIAAAHHVCGFLRLHNAELAEIGLAVDSNNATMRIMDRNFPEYNHPLRIGFKLEQCG